MKFSSPPIFDRGHVFTDRLLNRRGSEETLLIGASTMQRAIESFVPGARDPVAAAPVEAELSPATRKSRVCRARSAIVAFRAEEVYAIAEWIRRPARRRRRRAGRAIPRTRNAQVEMYQNGDVDYIVATDAIGMGLNLDVDHIAFAADRKFDGWQYRRLNPAEFGQIAGRAGRHMRDGTFGTSGPMPAIRRGIGRSPGRSSLRTGPNAAMAQLRLSIFPRSRPCSRPRSSVMPREPGLTRAPLGEDRLVLEIAARGRKK